ncbi:MAG: N-formylglutamate amidohydrolase [Ostreibacterium sp.]
MDTVNPFTIINEKGRSDWLLVCEHASRHIPARLANLGLSDEILSSHIGYDIGSYEMTLTLSKQLDATAVISNYSRLVIDCNRSLTSADCIPCSSDGVSIFANSYLSDEDRRLRINEIYQPFHTAVFQTLTNKLVHNKQTKFANIHSFTPILSEKREKRPWDIGFIYRRPEPSQTLINYIRQQTNYCVGDNQPYNGFIHKGYTVPAHADSQEIPGFLVEFRQDLIDHSAGVLHWSGILMDAMKVV